MFLRGEGCAIGKWIVTKGIKRPAPEMVAILNQMGRRMGDLAREDRALSPEARELILYNAERFKDVAFILATTFDPPAEELHDMMERGDQ